MIALAYGLQAYTHDIDAFGALGLVSSGFMER